MVAPLSCQDEADVVQPSDSDTSGSVFDDNFVTLEQASLIAENAELSGLVSNEPSLRTRVKKSKLKNIEDAKSINDRRGKAALHIFDYEGDEGGFSIISADKREMPILAYSEDGDFDVDDLENLPPGIISWLEMMEEEINAIREGEDITSTDEQDVALEWNNVLLMAEVRQSNSNNRTNTDPCDRPSVDCGGNNPPPVVVGPLLATRWGQGCGYNADTRIPSGNSCGRAPTGCVATAMAQIMRFYRSPSNYRWGDMPNTSGSTELSRLMADIGRSVGMNYTASSSGAQEENIPPALINTFSYSSASLRGYDKNTVKSNLNSNRPVILVGWRSRDCGFLGLGCSYTDGHAWVCDGYRQTWIGSTGYLYYSMNWGWNGSHNGWFAYANWNPGSLSFNKNQKMVTEIRP